MGEWQEVRNVNMVILLILCAVGTCGLAEDVYFSGVVI